MEAFNHKLNTLLESWIGPRDPRVKGWLLLDNYTPTFAFTVLYLLIVWIGPKYMKNRQPFSCRGLLLIHNLGLTLLSFYMCAEIVTAVWSGGYNLFCQDTHSAEEADNRVMKAIWWYYFSKLIEFMDTFFFILRKNNRQITFLHVYHHASMLNIWWLVVNWVPCGHSYFGPAINSFVHVIMYSYYGLSAIPALRPYLWWKKYITQLQMMQFFLTITQTAVGLIWPCDIHVGWAYFQISYIITLIFLFSNFYIKTYNKREHHNGSLLSTNGHANGTPSVEHKKLRVD